MLLGVALQGLGGGGATCTLRMLLVLWRQTQASWALEAYLTGFTFKQPLAELQTGVKTPGSSAVTLRHVLLSSDISDLLLLEVRNSLQSLVAPWVGLLFHLPRSAGLQLGCSTEAKMYLAASSQISLVSGTEPGCLWSVAPQQGFCYSGCPRLYLWLLQATYNSTCFSRGSFQQLGSAAWDQGS